MFKSKFRTVKYSVIYLSVIILLIIGYAFWHFDTISKNILSKVPNIVHFVLLHDDNIINADNETLNFISSTCILAAYFNHRPQKIILHSNIPTFTGNYWNIVSTIIGEQLQINRIERPTHVFGVPLSSIHHASDIVRIRTLYKHGGIFLGTYTFLLHFCNFVSNPEKSLFHHVR